MLVQADTQRLYSLAKLATQSPTWQEYGEYLRLRADGRRTEALRHLTAFLTVAERWSFPERQAFVLWLDQERPDGPPNVLIPEPLLRRILTPTCSEWLEREPDNAKGKLSLCDLCP